VFINDVYGTILWNEREWVWSHPQVRYLIVYEFLEQKGVFRQKMPTPKPKKDLPPALSDWFLSENFLRAVSLGERDPAPEIPSEQSWEIQNNVPLPVILIAASFEAIQDIIKQVLGVQEFNPSGLNPIIS